SRALRYDGVLAAKVDVTEPSPSSGMTADEIRALKRFIAGRRGEETPFDLVLEGVTQLGDPAQADAAMMPLAEAGATAWVRCLWDVPGGMDAVRARIRQGPPRI